MIARRDAPSHQSPAAASSESRRWCSAATVERSTAGELTASLPSAARGLSRGPKGRTSSRTAITVRTARRTARTPQPGRVGASWGPGGGDGGAAARVTMPATAEPPAPRALPFTAATNDGPGMRRSSAAASAITEAVRGTPASGPITPKLSPVEQRLTTLGGRPSWASSTTNDPDSTTYTSSDASP